MLHKGYFITVNSQNIKRRQTIFDLERVLKQFAHTKCH